MVVLIELLFTNWIHEDVNAGLLKLIDNVTNDEITYYGDIGQIKAVSEIYNSSKITFCPIEKIPNRMIADNKKIIPVYVKMLEKIILECKPSELFITAGTVPCMIAASIIAKLNPHINISMVIHDILALNRTSNSSCIKIMQKNLKIKNLKWILYNVYAENFLLKNGIDSGIFLHLPYIEAEKKSVAICKHEKIQIAVIGSCANENAVRLIEAVGRTTELTNKFEFLILSRYSNLFGGCKNIRILPSEFERGYKEELMQQLDYVLLPYGRNDYRASTSGVLMDAVSNKIPCLAYDSPCICYYQKRYHIGIQVTSLNEMITTLKKLVQSNVKENEYFINVKTMEQENQKTIKKILLRG